MSSILPHYGTRVISERNDVSKELTKFHFMLLAQKLFMKTCKPI